MKIVNMYQAKTHFSKLVDQVESGKSIIIGRAGKPVARLIAYRPKVEKRQPGMFAGQIQIAKDFDEEETHITNLFYADDK